MAANWRRWRLNEFELEMHLIMATGNKFEQSKATIVPIGLSADGAVRNATGSKQTYIVLS